RSTASRWTKGGVKFLAPSVPRNSSGLSHPLPACTTNIVGVLRSPPFFADMQEAPTTGAAPSGADNKKPPAGAASKMAKKAWMA
ncbi:unnamed protein product, partial [Brassica oleracea var. botrytis]